MALTIQEITDRERWNAFLISQPCGHLLQSYENGDLYQYLGARIYRVGALEDDRLIGTMLLSVSHVPLPVRVPGMQFNWLYCSRGPTVAHPGSPALAALVDHAHTLARREHAVALRLEPSIGDDDPCMDSWVEAYHSLGFRTSPLSVHARRSWVLDIRPDADQLLANFKRTWRQNVRVAERRGVIIREAQGDADFDAYYNLLKATSERRAFFIHPKDYHKEMLRQFARTQDAVLYLAEHEGDIIAAKMLIRFGTWCWDMFGASSNHKRSLKPGYLLQYRCLIWAQSCGCRYYDFRGIPDVLEPGEEMWGVYQFKRGFGGFSRLNLPTQDYVYRPLIYMGWRRLAKIRRARRHAQRHKVERVVRGTRNTSRFGDR